MFSSLIAFSTPPVSSPGVFRERIQGGNNSHLRVDFEEPAEAGRVSLLPNPSVPSVVSPPGTHGAIWSGTIFM